MTEEKEVIHPSMREDYKSEKCNGCRPAGDKTFTKYGKEIDIQDFINAGVEQVQIMKHIENAGGLENLRAAGLKDVDDTVIDRGLDFITLNRMNKVINITAKKLERERAEREQIEAELKKQEQQEQSESKGE